MEKHSLDFSAFPLKKMTWWDRLKFLFSGRPKDILPPPFDLEEVFGNQVTKPMVKSDLGRSYTTFAGCDVKTILVRGIGSDPSREEVIKAWSDHLHRKENRKGSCKVVGEASMISLVATVPTSEGQSYNLKSKEITERARPEIVTRGELICILFDRSNMKTLDRTDQHLLLVAANEYGDQSTFVIPHFEITGYSWGISTEDLVSEEHFLFEGKEPMHWAQEENPNAGK